MAKPLRIPRLYEDGLVKLHDLSDEAAQELLTALQKAPSTINEASISAEVSSRVDTVARSDLDDIVPALLSLYSLKDTSGSPVSELAEGIALGMKEGRLIEEELSSENRKALEERLVDLLSVDSLNVTVRAGNLLFQQENSLQSTRIVTDIRPVFEPEDPGAPPTGAMVVHGLKISYYADNELKDFFVSLDTSDVNVFKEQLERANAKAESIKSMLSAAGVRYISAD